MVIAMNIQAVKYSTRLEDFVVRRYGVILTRTAFKKKVVEESKSLL